MTNLTVFTIILSVALIPSLVSAQTTQPNTNDGLSTGAIVGIIVGAITLSIIGTMIVYCCCSVCLNRLGFGRQNVNYVQPNYVQPSYVQPSVYYPPSRQMYMQRQTGLCGVNYGGGYY